jgi:hypothetical protein
MAKQTINVGTSNNSGGGDPLRNAFIKINENFDEVYLKLNQLEDGELTSDIKGSLFGDDSTLLVDGINNSINLDGTISGNVIPDTDVAYDLGSASKRFRDLYLSGSTIDLGGTTLSVVGGALQVDGSPVVAQSDLTGYVTQAQLAAGSITVNATGDIQGSVFADDSTLLVDAVNGFIPTSVLSGTITNNISTSSLRTSEGEITLGEDAAAGSQTGRQFGIAIGRGAGYEEQGYWAVTIGGHGGIGDVYQLNQGVGAVSIGYGAGQINQGAMAVAVGYKAGWNTQHSGSIALNASGSALNTATSGFFVNPIRNQSSTGNILQYNTSTNEIIYSNDLGDLTGNLTGSVFADDSTLLVDAVNGTIPGYISITQLQTIAATSATYADFQAAIAAL